MSANTVVVVLVVVIVEVAVKKFDLCAASIPPRLLPALAASGDSGGGAAFRDMIGDDGGIAGSSSIVGLLRKSRPVDGRKGVCPITFAGDALLCKFLV